MGEISYTNAQLNAFVQNGYKKITGKQFTRVNYANHKVLNENQGNDFLFEHISEGFPFMACRYGYVELDTMISVERFVKRKNETRLQHVLKKRDISNNSGFFPMDKDMVIEFGEQMMMWSGDADLFGVWYIPFEEYALTKYAPNAELTFLRSYEPWNAIQPWTMALTNKKVLVVHPFAETISSQYKKRNELFPGKDILPQFDLKTYKAVQTIAGNIDDRFETWFEALDYMTEQIKKIDFDIAILGCGAYGLPLASRIKTFGKQAIHMGGATQLLFGIKGKRWDNHPIISKLYNQAWVRPSENEKPNNASNVEQGCYW